MLKGFSVQPSIASRGQRILATGFCLAACLWLCCWTAEAQTQTTNGQGQVRVASNTLAKPAARPPFTRTVHEPWNKLSASQGYFSIRVSEILEHPLYAGSLPSLWESLDILKKKPNGDQQSFSKLGLPVAIVSSVEATLDVHIGEIDEAESDESGHTKTASWTVGAGSMAITTSKDVDWPALVQELDLSSMTFNSAWIGNGFFKQLSKIAAPGRELVIPKFEFHYDSIPARPTTSPTPLEREIQKAMWNRVSGGIVTMVIDTSSLATFKQNIDSDAGSEFEREAAAADKLIRGIALGVDVSDSPNFEHVHMAFEPVEGTSADQLAQRVKQVLSVLADSYEADGEGHLARGLRQVMVKVESAEEGSFVFVTGKLSLIHMLSGLIKNERL